jgi:hypothetical protein
LNDREFDADGEQEKHDTDFSKHLNRADVGNEVQAMGPDQGAGDQETSDRGQAKLVEKENNGDGDGKNDQEIAEYAVISHDMRPKSRLIKSASRHAGGG